MILTYIYDLIWGKEEEDEEPKEEKVVEEKPKQKIKPIPPPVDYQKIIENYRKQEKIKQRKELVDYYKYGHF